jgi:aminopeptidase N
VSRTCSGGKAALTLTQDRFTIHDPSPKAETWRIPVTFGAPGGAAQHVLLTDAPLTAPIADCMTPIKVNLGENGYYRTQYDAASLKALAAALPTFSAADRADVLGDQFALFMGRRAPLQDYLHMLSGLKGEQNIAVWEDTLSHLRKLDTALDHLPEQKGFDAYAIDLIKPEFARLGWDAKPGEPFLDSLLRPELIAALGQFGDADVISEAHRRFQRFVASPASLSADVRSAVLGIVGHRADQATYDTLRSLGMKAIGTEEKLRYFFAMAAASDPALIKQNVAFARSGEIQNARIASFIAVASRTSGRPDLLYALVAPVAAELDAKAPGDGLQPTALMAAASGSADPATAKALVAEPSSTASSGARIQAERIADGVNTNAELRARAAGAVRAWLTAHNP